jgi:putative RecB family exonuclease
MPVFSHSRLSSFETCPLQYRLRYVDQVDIERRETVEAFVGRRVHETLEHLHERILDGVVLSRQEVLTHLQNLWYREWHDQVLIVRPEMTQQDYFKFGERCVTNYYRSNHPFDADRTVGIELAVIFPLDEERDIQIKGFVDRLARVAPGVYEIHDYKTTRRLPKQEGVDRDRQLAFYHMGIEHMMADASEVTLVWHFLAHNRKFRSSRSPEQLRKLRSQTLGLIDHIGQATAEGAFPANRSRLCDWCDYRVMCPAWNPVQETLTLDAGSGQG